MNAPLVRRLHEQLSSGAWPEEGMSPTNHVIGTLIILSAVVAIMETEARLVDEAAWLFEIGAVIFPVAFAIEYGARVYAAGAEARYAGMRGR